MFVVVVVVPLRLLNTRLSPHSLSKAVDIVLGGPPCQDYSAVNAHRRGAEGRYGRYLHEFGRFIRRLEQKQGHKIYFMAENVNIMGFKDMSVVEEAFQTPGLLLDAKEFSPCRRNRHYFLNVSVDLSLECACGMHS